MLKMIKIHFQTWLLVIQNQPLMTSLRNFGMISKPMGNLSLVMRKSVLPYANNKGADQPAHSGSLNSIFVVGSLDSIIPVVAMY